MPIIRRSAGLGTLLLSGLGLLLCVAGIVALFIAKPHLDRITTAIFTTADDAFVFMETKLDRVQQIVGNSRERVTGLTVLAERLKTASESTLPETGPLLQTLEDALSQLKDAQHWLESSQAMATGIHRMSQAIVLAGNADPESPRERVNAKRVMEFSAAVSDVLARLEQLRQELKQHRDRRTLAREVATTVITHISELDERLANLSARIANFNTEITTARTSCNDYGKSVQWWITFVMMMLALIFLWFGLSQIDMLRSGYRLTRGEKWPK